MHHIFLSNTKQIDAKNKPFLFKTVYKVFFMGFKDEKLHERNYSKLKH
jgi:hypothetical protein